MKNQITVVVASDGRIVHTEQVGVFRRSNKQNELVALLDFPLSSVVKVNFLRPDGVKPKSQYMTYTEQTTYNAIQYSKYTYVLTDFQLETTGILVASLDVTNNGTLATSGDFTIDVEASESANDDVAPTDPNQYDQTLQSLMQTDAILLDRTANVPNLVASIQKVEGKSNAITYTTESGLVSAPIVIGAGSDPPAYLMASYTGKIPDSAWQPILVGTETVGYTYTVPAAVHGQMKDGATADDLWVSFLDPATASQGEIKSYSVNSVGDIVVTVNEPVDLTVRVWNGKGLKGPQGETGEIGPEGKQGERGRMGYSVLLAKVTLSTSAIAVETTNIDIPIGYEVKVGDVLIDKSGKVFDITGVGPTLCRIEYRQSIMGPTPQVTVGTTDTLPAGSDAVVYNAGTEPDVILNFGIPKGADGEDTLARQEIAALQSEVNDLKAALENSQFFKGYYATNAEIQALAATEGDFAYSAESGTKWIYSAANGWVNSGEAVPDQVTPKSTTLPLAPGTASVGTETAYAAGDHRHPKEVGKVTFTATGWTLVNHIRGAYAITLTVPSGKHIFNVLENLAEPTPRGSFAGATVYANSPFAGYAIIE